MSNGLLGVYLLLCSMQDIRKKQISIGLLVAGLLAAVVCRLYTNTGGWLYAVIPGLSLLLFARVTRESIGYGDGMMLLTAGIFLGAKRTVALLWVALLLAAVFSLTALLAKRCGRKSTYPFAPFLLAAWILMRIGGI